MDINKISSSRISNLQPINEGISNGSHLSFSENEYNMAKDNFALFAPCISLNDKNILDAGCGMGGKTVYYAENGSNSVMGLDRDANHIRYAKEFALKREVSNVEFLKGNLISLPFESNWFDIIFLNDVVEHIRRPILINALAECKRVVKADGKICLEFPPWTSPYAAHLNEYIKIPWCQFVFSSDSLIRMTKKKKPQPRYGQLSVIERFQELNHITIEEFKSVINELDLKVINFELHMINNIKNLRSIPFFNKFLTTRVVAVLSK
jgi:ubiquinone/menaquinone biosynthesis C-methylase UbiE